jgi:hypothetical protein
VEETAESEWDKMNPHALLWAVLASVLMPIALEVKTPLIARF